MATPSGITVELTGGDGAMPRGEQARHSGRSRRTPTPSGAARGYAAQLRHELGPLRP
jgi:hypothetical protein